MDDKEFKEIVAKNIIKHRKRLGLTQLELAQKLNYTDKSVSKWERAETLPDAFVLKQLSDLFNITINDFAVEEDKTKKAFSISSLMKKKIAIPLLSVLLNFFVATIIFCLLALLKEPIQNVWLILIYAIPSASVILIVFSSKWWEKYMTAISVSMLNWSLALSLFLSFSELNNMSWLFFLISGTFQLLIITWFLFFNRKKTKPKE